MRRRVNPNKPSTMIKGKRTYLIALMGAAYALLIGLGILPNEEWVWGLLGFTGMGFLRAGVENSSLTQPLKLGRWIGPSEGRTET